MNKFKSNLSEHSVKQGEKRFYKHRQKILEGKWI